MKAAQFSRFGGPEVLQLVDLPDPHPGPGEVRIAVRAAGVNASDWKKRQGLMDPELPQTLGYEAAGVVDEALNLVLDDRLKQRLLRREVAVDGPGPDSGAARDLVDRHGQAFGRKGFVGDVQHPGTVTGRVGAQLPYRLRHRSHHPSQVDIAKRGVRSV